MAYNGELKLYDKSKSQYNSPVLIDSNSDSWYLVIKGSLVYFLLRASCLNVELR